MISLRNNWRRELKKILHEYKPKPTINTSVAKKENPSINQRKGQIGLVFDGEIRKRVNFLRLSIHQIGSSANHLSAQNQSITLPHVVVTPHYYLSFDHYFYFWSYIVFKHIHTGTVIICLTTIHIISTAKMHVLTTMTSYYLDYTMPWSTNVIMDRLLMSIIDVGKGIQLKMVRGVILPLFIDILFSFLELLSLFDLLR